ncbi:MAG: flagellar hook-length control protein FliK [Bordetella sp.]|uniref:flagellar hook-length control protein FliK n=1 Tax=Bordetella sp. TaxID=28081 RepID=UPI003F7B979A
MQRLDAVLGTSMSAYANLLNGARPDAVAPTADPEKNPQLDENGQPILPEAEGDTAQQIANAKTATALSLAARGLVTSTDLTPSAPTTLGATARTILALLAQSPDKAPPSQGKAPLWTGLSGDQEESRTSSAGGGPGRAPGTPTPIGQQTNAAVAQAGRQSDDAQGQQQQQPQTAASSNAASVPTPVRAGQQTPATLATGQTAGMQPTAASSTTQAAQITLALRAAVQETGLFYESHLTQMVFGQRTAQEIAREPQAQLNQGAVITRDTPVPAPAANVSASAPTNAQTMPAATQGGAWNGAAPTVQGTQSASIAQQNATGGGSSTSLSLSSSLAGGGNPLAGIHPAATSLVHQQLDVLANQSFAWQGQAWPGAHMEWEVSRDRTQGGELMDNDHWATRLQVELPRLGMVQARLTLAGNQVVMSLVAPSSAGELSQNSNALRQQFVSAGLALSQLTVDSQPPSPFDLS